MIDYTNVIKMLEAEAEYFRQIVKDQEGKAIKYEQDAADCREAARRHQVEADAAITAIEVLRSSSETEKGGAT
jgi:hypothetical protein